jgi:MFS family permease
LLSEYRTIPPEARLLIYVGFVPGLALGFIYTDLSYFLTRVQGMSDFFTGTVITVMGVTTVLMSLPMGVLADRYGRRRFLIVGNVLASVTLTAFAISTDAIVLLAAAVVEGTTEAAYAASGSALLTDKAGDKSRTSAFSLSAVLSSIAWGLGGFAIPLVIVLESFGLDSVSSHRLLYFALAALSIAVTPLLLKVSETPRTSNGRGLREFLPRRSKSVLLRYAVTSTLVAFGAGFFVPLMSRWFYLAYGVSDTVSGPIIGVSGFMIALTTLAAPRLARRFGLVKSIVVTQGASTLFMFAVPLSPTFIAAGAIYTVRSFMMNLSNPLVQSMVMGLVAPEERGAAAGITAAIWRLPNSISTSIGAGLMGSGLLALPFYLATGLYVVSIGLFWVFFRAVRLPEEAHGVG